MLKKFTLVFAVCMVTMCSYLPACADVITTISAPSHDAEIQRGDVYVYKYTYINGIRCRRLWNATKGEWAEATWTPCP